MARKSTAPKKAGLGTAVTSRYYARENTNLYVGWCVMHKVAGQAAEQVISMCCSEAEAPVIAAALNDHFYPPPGRVVLDEEGWKVRLAVDMLNGELVKYPGFHAAYFSGKTESWWVVTKAELVRLADALGDRDRQARWETIYDWEENPVPGGSVELDRSTTRSLELPVRPRREGM